MAKKLTKGVLNGTQYRETMKVEWKGEEYEVEIRALDNMEATAVEELTQEGINVTAKPGIGGKMQRSMSFDAKENFRGRKRSNVLATALGTTDESLTEQVIQEEFPPALIEKIGERVKEISGINNDDEVEEFRTEHGEESGGSESEQ